MTLSLAVSIAFVAAAGSELQPNGRMVPFTVPVIDSWGNSTNISWLNEQPAGKHGFIAVENGRFVDAEGKRIRFIGGAFCHGASFPTHEMAERVAPRLAMTGFNLVRLHHMDGRTKPNGIWRIGESGRPEIDPEQLDRLDYLIAQFKRHGVYANINLKVSRRFRESEGCPDAKVLAQFSKGPDYFDPRMIELQKQYARELLTHVNPYTKARCVDDPAIAFVEINNENSLLGNALRGRLTGLPPHYAKQLDAKWIDWLKQRYGTTAKLAAAWRVTDEPLGETLLTNGDFAKGLDSWHFSVRDTKHGTADVSRDGPDARPCVHVTATRPGRLAWTFQLHQIHLDLEPDQLYTLSFWLKAKPATTVQCIVRLDHRCPRTKRYRIVGLHRSVQAEPRWRRYEFAFRADDPAKDGNRVGFTFPNAPGEYWIADVQLRPGGVFGLRKQEDLAAGRVARPAAPSAAPERDLRWLDYVRFVAEIDQAYALAMYRFLKHDLGVKCPVINTQASYGGIAGILRESKLDYIDMHAYWDHPRFPRKSWDMRDWLVRNQPMVADEGGGIIARLACHRVEGKPFIVSEFNQASPNAYAAECWPIVAACAAVQDWDAIIMHNYVNYTHEDWSEPRIRNFFDGAAHPAKIPFVLAAAMAFRRGDVAPAEQSAILTVPMDMASGLSATLRGSQQGSDLWLKNAKVQADTLVNTRLAMRFVPGTGEPKVEVSRGRGSGVKWDPKAKLFTVDSPATKVIVGMIANREAALGPWTLNLGESTNDFAAATLTALDGKPVERSSKLVLALMGTYGNTGMSSRKDQAMLASWGAAPSLAEAVPAHVRLRTAARGMTVYALDGKGERTHEVPSRMDAGVLAFDAGPAHRTIWYELRGK